MSDPKIDRIKYIKEEGQPTLQSELFFNGPAEFLCAQVCACLIKVPQWKKFFGEFVNPYMRMDYGMRNLPALRIYNRNYNKTSESWFIEGDLIADVIYPPEIRRTELQQIPDTVSTALLQQFRSVEFFQEICALIPALNELGKTFGVDKSLGFDYGGNDVAPLTQIRINFKIDLREWDLYLEETNRTKDSPFDPVLANLDRISTVIDGLRAEDPEQVDVKVNLDQQV